MRWHLPSVLVVTLGASSAGCSAPHTVSLLHTAGAPITPTPSDAIPLEVVTRSTGVREPMAVRGTDLAFADLETTVGTSVASAAAPWASAHLRERPGGWQLQVELIEARADYTDSRLTTTMGVRLTLRTRDDHRYLAQSQASCQNAALVPPGEGAPVIYGCMQRMGRDVASWLQMVQP